MIIVLLLQALQRIDAQAAPARTHLTWASGEREQAQTTKLATPLFLDSLDPANINLKLDASSLRSQIQSLRAGLPSFPEKRLQNSCRILSGVFGLLLLMEHGGLGFTGSSRRLGNNSSCIPCMREVFCKRGGVKHEPSEQTKCIRKKT